MIKSDFVELLPEDIKEYRRLSKEYMALVPEDGDLAFRLMKESWALAQRWSEIQACSRKIHDMAKIDFSVTAFKDWAYQKYRQMQNIHDSTRMIWSRANEEATWLKRQGLSRKDLK